MKRTRTTVLAILFVCCPLLLLAADSTGFGGFYKQLPGGDRRVHVEDATLVDKIYFQFVIYTGDDGDHSLHINVYDGQNREVYNSESTLVSTGGRASGTISYGFNAVRDAPGTWWYVAAIDGEIVVTESLEVRR